jgi:hypothetical protein
MVRTILKPAHSSFTLQLPDDLIGKTVEVIAFEVEDIEEKPIQKLKPSQLRGFLSAEAAQKMQEKIQKDRDEWHA